MTPPASRAAERPCVVDDALVERARSTLGAAVEAMPPAASPNGQADPLRFAGVLYPLCATSRCEGVPVEKLIIAIKLAWASLPELRLRLGDAEPDVLSGVITACIETYFADARARAD